MTDATARDVIAQALKLDRWDGEIRTLDIADAILSALLAAPESNFEPEGVDSGRKKCRGIDLTHSRRGDRNPRQQNV